MKGDILYYDDNSGNGQISGDDGNRYDFNRADLKQLLPVDRGTRVDFAFDGRHAIDIYLLPENYPATVGRVPSIGTRQHSGSAEPDLGLWGYFKHSLTSGYADFYGRARRKEYWGFHLFAFLLYMAFAVGMLVFFAMVGSRSGVAAADRASGAFAGIGIIAIVGFVVALLALILPSIAVTVRRFHDIGQSGWIVLLLYVLGIVPVLGIVTSIILLVMVCLDTQPGENKYGPPPKLI